MNIKKIKEKKGLQPLYTKLIQIQTNIIQQKNRAMKKNQTLRKNQASKKNLLSQNLRFQMIGLKMKLRKSIN